MNQFEVALQLLGLKITKKEFKKICKRADRNGDDKIQLEEFTKLVLSYSFNYAAEELTHRSNGNASITPRSPRKDASQEQFLGKKNFEMTNLQKINEEDELVGG